jgi:hypothetical protein
MYKLWCNSIYAYLRGNIVLIIYVKLNIVYWVSKVMPQLNNETHNNIFREIIESYNSYKKIVRRIIK